MKSPFEDRSVIEIMVLVFTLVVAWAIVASGALIAIIEFRDPTADTTGEVRALTSLITLILGALLGLLAGKTSVMDDLSYRPGEGPIRGQHKRLEGVGEEEV